MNRANIFILLIVFTGINCAGCTLNGNSQQKQRPNVLLLLVDDLKPSLGVYAEGFKMMERQDERWLCKPSRTYSSHGLYQSLAEDPHYDRFVLQERLRNHDGLTHVSRSEALQTVRIVTLINSKGNSQVINALLKIAKGQLEIENNIANIASDFLFCDTDILVNKIWGQVVFGKVHDWINKNLSSHQYDLYLLCYPDLKWENGLFRENPDDRENLFALYEKELQRNRFNYKVVKGYGDFRFQNALNFVGELIL